MNKRFKIPSRPRTPVNNGWRVEKRATVEPGRRALQRDLGINANTSPFALAPAPRDQSPCHARCKRDSIGQRGPCLANRV